MTDVILRAINGGGQPARSEPHEGAVAALRELLAKAEAGEVRDLAWAYVRLDGGLSYGAVGEDNGIALIGSVTVLLRDLSGALEEE